MMFFVLFMIIFVPKPLEGGPQFPSVKSDRYTKKPASFRPRDEMSGLTSYTPTGCPSLADS
jgi:hypothetical protein